MKELEKLTQDQKEVTPAQEKKEILLGRFSQQAGHTLFQYDKTKDEMSICKFENATIDLATGNTTNKKIIYSSDCLYVSALNKNNAAKKFSKMLDKNVPPVLND